MKKKEYLQEDEIDLKELFLTIWKYKVFIAVFTIIITILSIVYVVYFKNPKPIYKGSLLIKIGEIKTTNLGLSKIGKAYDLKYILEKENSNINISIPKSSSTLFLINAEDISKEKIKNEIENTYKILLSNEKEKLKFYDNYIPTKKIGKIVIDNNPINKPKKKLIVAVIFVTSFILAVFLVFFIEFVKSFKKEENI